MAEHDIAQPPQRCSRGSARSFCVPQAVIGREIDGCPVSVSPMDRDEECIQRQPCSAASAKLSSAVNLGSTELRLLRKQVDGQEVQ